MAVYVTKNMLSKMNRNSYPSFAKLENVGVDGDHWQRLSLELSSESSMMSKALLCRVCGCDGYTPITEKIGGVAIIDALRSICNVNIESNDSLPKFICTSCVDKLKIAIEFKDLCQTSDRKFKKILYPMGDPNLHAYPYSKHDFQLILKNMKEKRMQIEEKRERERLNKEQMKLKKNNKGKTFTCSSCDMSFTTKEQLCGHRRSAQCARRACEECGEVVAGLRAHRRAAHRRPHACPLCHKQFPVHARLKNHMLVHTNTFNFFCDLCPYKCKHKYYLVMHMRTHTGEKPYKCALCPATFVNPSNLNKHKLTHQEKQFKCTLCEKSFRTNAALREHHEAAHMNIKHTCRYCGREFCYRSDLRKHEIRSHNRTKRDYIGGEPTYKQVERLQRAQDEAAGGWPPAPPPPPPAGDTPHLIHATYIEMEASKQYPDPPAAPPAPAAAYYTEPTAAMLHTQTLHMFQPQTVEITLPELTMKKDEVKITYEPQQGIGYF